MFIIKQFSEKHEHSLDKYVDVQGLPVPTPSWNTKKARKIIKMFWINAKMKFDKQIKMRIKSAIGVSEVWEKTISKTQHLRIFKILIV